MMQWFKKFKEAYESHYKDALLKLFTFNEVASEQEIQTAEQALGVKFSLAYREFLKITNGGDIYANHWFSLTELLAYNQQEAFFKAWAGEIEISGDGNDFYGEKPFHLLIFRDLDFCFDTSKTDENGEYPICHFDPDFELEDNHSQTEQNFEHHLLKDVYENFLEDVDTPKKFPLLYEKYPELIEELKNLYGQYEEYFD